MISLGIFALETLLDGSVANIPRLVCMADCSFHALPYPCTSYVQVSYKYFGISAAESKKFAMIS